MSELLTMSRERLAAIAEAFRESLAQRALAACPHPACTELAWAVSVERLGQTLHLDDGPRFFPARHLLVTFEPCGHVFHVPHEETGEERTPRAPIY